LSSFKRSPNACCVISIDDRLLHESSLLRWSFRENIKYHHFPLSAGTFHHMNRIHDSSMNSLRERKAAAFPL
jgi:hypothetical protein